VFVFFIAFLVASLLALPGAAFGQTTGGTPGAGTPAAAASPTAVPAGLTLSSSKGAPNSQLTVNGVGFKANETVTVSFNGDAVGTPSAGSGGNFSLAFTVPNLGAGVYGITAVGKDSVVSPSTSFEIALGAASLKFSVDTAAAGTAVAVQGTGFQPGENVMLHFNGPEVATGTADTAGNVTFNFTIPATLAAGTYGATAMGESSGAEANVNFPVTAGAAPVATAVPTAQATPAPAPAATPVPNQPVPNAPAVVHDDRYFSQTGYRIDNDQVWSFFQSYGAVSTFGYPTSRMITFLGCPVQFFQRQIIQVCPSQGPALINMLDPDIFPYTNVNGSQFPALMRS